MLGGYIEISLGADIEEEDFHVYWLHATQFTTGFVPLSQPMNAELMPTFDFLPDSDRMQQSVKVLTYCWGGHRFYGSVRKAI